MSEDNQQQTMEDLKFDIKQLKAIIREKDRIIKTILRKYEK